MLNQFLLFYAFDYYVAHILNIVNILVVNKSNRILCWIIYDMYIIYKNILLLLVRYLRLVKKEEILG